MPQYRRFARLKSRASSSASQMQSRSSSFSSKNVAVSTSLQEVSAWRGSCADGRDRVMPTPGPVELVVVVVVPGCSSLGDVPLYPEEIVL